MLRILLLGPPVILDEDRPLRVMRRMQRALLFYLACQPGPVSRADLILLFWPDEKEPDARRNLRQELSRLRAQLGDDDVWQVEPDRVGLDFNRVYVDYQDFQNLLRQVWTAANAAPPQVPLPGSLAERITRALDLWRSPRFMDGMGVPEKKPDFEKWMDERSHELDYTRQRLLERMGHHVAATGDLENGIYYMNQALAGDELNEHLHFHVLNWLHQLGRRSEALRMCAQVSTLFEQEDGSVPPALSQLCARIRRESASPGEGMAAWPLSLGLQVPFIGRDRLLRDLRLAFGHGGSVLLTGESGSGKTRLVHQLLATLDPPPRLLLAPARPTEQSLPFQPFIEMLRTGITREEWRTLEAPWVMRLVRLAPELVSLRPDVSAETPPEPGETQAQIFEALRQLLLLAARTRRLLFFLDDLQWCDESSLAALAYLQERGLFANTGLLVMAARPEEGTAQIESITHRMGRSFGFVHFAVPPLALEEINALVQVAFGEPAQPGLAERLEKATGGNTFYLLETLRAGLERQPSNQASISPDTLPLAPSVAGLLRARLARISPDSRQALEAAAVIGRTFCPEVLEMVGALGPEEAVAALEELESALLVRPADSGEEPGCYSFIHDLFREALLASLSLARRRLLHQRTAAALEITWKGRSYQRAAVMAEHYESAGAVENAFNYWLRAAQHALHLFAHAESNRAYQRAEALLVSAGQRLPDECIYRLYASLGELAYAQANAEGIQRAYGAMQRYGEQRGSPLLIGSALSGMASIQVLRSQVSEGLALLDRAMPYIQEANDPFEKMRIYSRRGYFYLFQGENTQSMANYQYAIGLASGTNDPRLRQELMYAQTYQAYNHSVHGWPLRALAICDRLLEENTMRAHVTDLINVRNSAATACYFAGKFHQALEHVRQGRELTAKLGSKRMDTIFRLLAARSDLMLGNLDACLEHSEAMLAYTRQMRYDLLVAEAYRVRADVLLWLNHPQEALPVYQQANLPDTYDNYVHLEARARLGYCLGMCGQIEPALALLERVVETCERNGTGIVLLPARFYRWKLLLGNTQDATERDQLVTQLEQLALECRQRGMPRLEAMVSLTLAAHWQQVEQPSRARELLAGVRKQAAETGALLIEIYACSLGAGSADELEGLLTRLSGNARNPEIQTYVDRFCKSFRCFV